jgi:hypothetical protein
MEVGTPFVVADHGFGRKHWCGATPTTAMTHIAVQEALDGKVVDWHEPVTDEQYLVGSKSDRTAPPREARCCLWRASRLGGCLAGYRQVVVATPG